MLASVTAPSLPEPAAAYSLAIRTTAVSEWLHTSGIVPTRADGSVPDQLDDQLDVIWATLLGLLVAGGFAVTDVVSLTTYVVAGNDLAVVMAARDTAMAGHRPASTLITVPALARPEWRAEIAVIAAR